MSEKHQIPRYSQAVRSFYTARPEANLGAENRNLFLRVPLSRHTPIPGTLNLIIAAVQLMLLLSLLLLTAFAGNLWQVGALALGYGILMNSGYAMLHEAEHNLLHRNKRINDAVGVLLALFFPAPFHLLRQGHIGHHMRNRSDDEAFDFYFEGENKVWKYLQLYGILTGLFWCVIVTSNLLAVVYPKMLTASSAKKTRFDRPTEALVETLNPKFLPYIRLEAAAVILLHGSILYFMNISIVYYACVLFGFGFLWSALQYVHHFGTNRDVQNGALNLKTFRWLDLIWLNHNWHLRHHQEPTVPWVYLPHLGQGSFEKRGSVLNAYLAMWKGPRKTKKRVKNRYAGKIIR